jgi:hypothetical protein
MHYFTPFLVKRDIKTLQCSQVLLQIDRSSYCSVRATPMNAQSCIPSKVQPYRTPEVCTKHLRVTAVTLRPVAAEAPVEIFGRIRAQSVPAICTDNAAFLLRLADLLLQLRGTGIDELELRELGVEDADDLCELSEISIG